MDRELRQTLERLHDELAQSQELDDDTRALLTEVVQDIESVLHSPGEGGSEHTGDSLVDRLRAATRDFEESHPSLTAAVGRVADALSSLGI